MSDAPPPPEHKSFCDTLGQKVLPSLIHFAKRINRVILVVLIALLVAALIVQVVNLCVGEGILANFASATSIMGLFVLLINHLSTMLKCAGWQIKVDLIMDDCPARPKEETVKKLWPLLGMGYFGRYQIKDLIEQEKRGDNGEK